MAIARDRRRVASRLSEMRGANMKQHEIKPCALCGKGIMHDGNMTFYRVRVERTVVNLGAVRRQAGLEMMVGNAAIAHALGPNEDIATTFNGPHDAFVCETCALDDRLLYRICDQGTRHG